MALSGSPSPRDRAWSGTRAVAFFSRSPFLTARAAIIFIVGQGRVTGAGGLVMSRGSASRGELVDMGDIFRRRGPRIGHRADHGLRRGASATVWRPRMDSSAQGLAPLILANDHGEAAQHVLQDGQALLHMVFHSCPLGGRATSSDDDGSCSPQPSQGRQPPRWRGQEPHRSHSVGTR